MTRNWYAVYTRPQREKKVASILTKKGIKNFFPVNKLTSSITGSKKICNESLFSNCIFVYIMDSQIDLVKSIPGTINFMHWLAKPAIIKREEVEAVRQLTTAYSNIKVERTIVNINDVIRIIDEPTISFKENSASVLFNTLKIVLPSFGYIMIAQRDAQVVEKSQQEVAQPDFYTNRVNTFFAN